MVSKHLDSLSDLNKDTKREASLIKRYGSLENYRKAAKEWGRRGGKRGGNGLQMLTFEQRSEQSKKNVKIMRESMRARIKEEVRRELEEEL